MIKYFTCNNFSTCNGIGSKLRVTIILAKLKYEWFTPGCFSKLYHTDKSKSFKKGE